jgi:hypothetical protein
MNDNPVAESQIAQIAQVHVTIQASKLACALYRPSDTFKTKQQATLFSKSLELSTLVIEARTEAGIVRSMNFTNKYM